jgi:frataxin-like iron-binding protein CyaY
MWITECMCIQGENLLCEFGNDEIIINKKNKRSAIWGVN